MMMTPRKTRERVQLDSRHSGMSMAHERDDVQQVPLDKIRTDGGTQMREGLDEGIVEEYAEVINGGRSFNTDPEVIYDGTNYWLVDGFHRVAAYYKVYKELKVKPGAIQCRVRPGTRRDAVYAATGANQDHGLRRSNATKRNAVEAHLRDPEWAKSSDREIANFTGVHHSTVGRIRKQLEHTGALRQSIERIGADGRVMDTSGISAANAERHQPERREVKPARESPELRPPVIPSPPVYTGEPPRPDSRPTEQMRYSAAKLGRVSEYCGLLIDGLSDFEEETGHTDTSAQARAVLRKIQAQIEDHLKEIKRD